MAEEEPVAATPADRRCRFVSRDEAFRRFAAFTGPTQSQMHIKPVHWYVACRLVLEGGFRPEDIKPRPPFLAVREGASDVLHYRPDLATGEEETVLGGLKTKNVDVVVALEGLGPVLAISCKGMTGALRNLTNRMEELIGECTNLHITYPALVFGFLFLLLGHRAEAAGDPPVAEGMRGTRANDIAIQPDGRPAPTVLRFHNALAEITGRRGIRNDVSRYEAVSLSLVGARGEGLGDLLADFPAADDLLRWERFFPLLYQRYEDRFVFGAPDLRARTGRRFWSPASPAFSAAGPFGGGFAGLDFAPRLAES